MDFDKVVADLIEDIGGKVVTKEKVDEVTEKLKKAVVCWASAQVGKTETKIDDAVVKVLAEALGVDPSTCPAA